MVEKSGGLYEGMRGCRSVYSILLGKHKEFFPHFTVKKSSLPLAAEWLSCLYVQRIAYKYEICKECLWIKSFLSTTGKKGLGNRL